MKRILSLVLSIIMMFSLCACGNNEKAEKYCSSCGEGISKDVAFCEHCGAAVNNEKTESEDTSSDNSSSTESKTEETCKTPSATESTNKPTASSKTDTSSKASSSTIPSTSKPSTPSHTHSYSKKVTAATCTKKGYTTYTCSCGDTYKDKYTNPSHTYSQYICTKCGIHDKEHTYEFLVEYVKHYGEPYATTVRFDVYDNGKVYLTYDAENKNLYICSYSQDGNGFNYCSVSLKTYFYGLKLSPSSGQSADVTGYMDAKNYTSEAPLDDVHYNGPSNAKYVAVEAARTSVAYLIAVLDDICDQIGDDLNLTMSDLGFTSYK